jgi:hypothetical protein
MGRGLRAIAIAVLAAACALACNAILGITAVPLPEDGGGGGEGDAAADAGKAPTDSAATCTAADTTSDTHNCGACGHDCLGGQCSNSACQPVALVAEDAGVSPWGLAQDGTYLYWTDLPNGTVNRTNKVDGGTTLMTTQTSGPHPIAVDDAGMYWGDYNGVWLCSKSTCSQSVMPTQVANVSGPVLSVAVDNQSVYWTENSTQVLSANKYGNKENGSVIWQGDASTNNVATDGQRVYFTAVDGVLRAVGVDGGAGFQVGTPAAAPSEGVALSTGYVYWTLADPSQGVVNTSSTTSPSGTVLASTQLGPYSVASDGVNAYWANLPNTSGNAQIVECVVASCTPKVVAHGFHPNAIVVDDVAVYWTDSQNDAGVNGGSLWKLAK